MPQKLLESRRIKRSRLARNCTGKERNNGGMQLCAGGVQLKKLQQLTAATCKCNVTRAESRQPNRWRAASGVKGQEENEPSVNRLGRRLRCHDTTAQCKQRESPHKKEGRPAE